MLSEDRHQTNSALSLTSADVVTKYKDMKNTIFLFTLILFFSCASPQKYFDKGDYDKAYKTALKTLKSNSKKGFDENKRVLISSLEKIIEREYDRISNWNNSNEEKDWDKALDGIDALKLKMEESGAYTNNYFEPKYAAIEKKEAEIKLSVFDFYKNRGIEHLEKYYETEKKINAQYAHQDLSKANSYAEKGAGLDSLMKEAYSHAVLNIYVEAEVLFGISQEWEVDRMFDDITEYSGGYRRIVFEQNMDNIDCRMDIDFRRIDFDERDRTDRRDFEQRVIVDYETVIDTAGNKTETPIYDTVEGEVTITTITKTATWEVEVDIDAVTHNCRMSSSGFQAQRSSSIREIRTRGDERAIPAEYLNPDREEFEDEDDTIEYLLEELYAEIVGYYF